MATWIDDKFRTNKQLKSGGMSNVYLCWDADDNSVIVKLFNPCDDNDTNSLQKKIFQREVEALERVHHPNIVKILDKGYDENFQRYYIVLEYIDGQNFKELYDDICAYSEYQKFELMNQVLEAVEYLHKKNVIHRDLKPSNIMLTTDNKIKIIDFGISKLYNSFYGDYTVANYSTPKYRSPEQAAEKKIDCRSDIFSLGLIFYEIFSNLQFSEKSDIDIVKTPVRVRPILEKMLQDDINSRFNNVSEIRQAINIEKSNIQQSQYLEFSLTNAISRQLCRFGYLSEENNVLTVKEVENDLSGKTYFKTNNRNGEISYWLMGKQFIFICKLDQFNNKHFVITGVYLKNSADLAQNKEEAYVIPYEVRVSFSLSRVKSDKEITADILIDELNQYEERQYDKKQNETHIKDICRKWENILLLQEKHIDNAKNTLKYKSFIVNVVDNSILLDISKESLATKEINFSSDEMLQMTSAQSLFKQVDVGYMREVNNGQMVIDLAANVDINTLAESGEVSISMRMMEISLQRQKRALKSLKFREIVNPQLTDIIFNPGKAISKGNFILSKKDCKSTSMDDSKLDSIAKALSAKDLFLLQGPPGTGKTTFISELVYQILYGNSSLKGNLDSRILISSQSHVAVDNSLVKIQQLIPDIKMIRIGIKEKFSSDVLQYTLDAFCENWSNEVIERCKSAVDQYRTEVGLDDNLQESNSIIKEIESLMQSVKTLNEELSSVEREKEKLSIIYAKWNEINDVIDTLNNTIDYNKKEISSEKLAYIFDNCMENLTKLSNKLSIIVEESVQISDQLEVLSNKRDDLAKSREDKNKEIKEWQEILGISSEDEFIKVKDEITQKIKNGQEQYDKFSRIKNLCNEWIKRVKQGNGLLEESLADATIVGATCLGIAGLKASTNLIFDWVIIDEAGKATPSEILVPIALGKKVILVGDHKQLPPVVDETILESSDNLVKITRKDLEMSLFEYLVQNVNDNCKSILNKQYRMNPVIGNLISQLFYDGKLVSIPTKKEKTIPLKMYDNKPLVWLSTAKMKNNSEETIGDTYRNNCEVTVIFEQLHKIDHELDQLNQKKEVAIIAGYSAQKDLINRIYESQYLNKFKNISIEINTVDAFQGRETDVVFYSIVRSNKQGNLGFLKDVRRLNVAFSRARELLIVVGNHTSAIKRMNINNMPNPFVQILKYIDDNVNDCYFKEVK